MTDVDTKLTQLERARADLERGERSNVVADRRGSGGSKVGADLPEAIEIPELSRLERLESATLDTEAVQRIEPAPSVIEGFLFADSLALPFGPSGAGKSFLGVEWALCVTTATPWHDHDVAPGPVVYVVAEGRSGIGNRVAAWLDHYEHPPLEHPIHWLTHPVHLFDPAWTQAFADYCAAREPALVIIDTLTRCAVGADENLTKDMGVLVDHLDRVRATTGACVAPIHHAGKDITKGARGNTALRAAMTTELEVTGDKETTTIKTTKQRDAAEAPPLTLRRHPVGDSCVLLPARADSLINSGALDTLAALREIETPEGLSPSQWQSTLDVSERTFYRHRKTLLDCHLIKNVGTDKRPRYISATTSENADDDQ